MDEIKHVKTHTSNRLDLVCNRCKLDTNFLWEFLFVKKNPDHNFTERLCLDCTRKLLNKQEAINE